MERLKRYYKKVVAIVFSLMLIASGVLSTSFSSRAGLDFSVSYAEPSKSENQGYLVVLFQNMSNNELQVMTFFWSTYAQKAGYESPCEMLINVDSASVSFNLNQYGADGGWYSLGAVTENNHYRALAQNSSSSYTYDLSYWNCEILGWKLGGSGYVDGLRNTWDFNIYFNNSGDAIWLQLIIEELTEQGATSNSMLLILSNILKSLDGESNTNSVVSYLKSIDDELVYSYNRLTQLYEMMRDTTNYYLLSSMDSLIAINNRLTQFYEVVRDTTNYYLLSMNNRLTQFYEMVRDKTNYYLIEIMDNIKAIANPTDADKNASNEYKEESSAQKNEMDSLNEQNQMNKVDVNGAVSNVDANINYDDMTQYGGVLATITNNQYVLQLILVVVSISIISYVLFGKR